jgi:pimeloyl-ACP methyl ester carboxylesterase
MTDGYVDAGGVRTYYEMEGEGAPLILLHGGFSTIDDWRGIDSLLQSPVGQRCVSRRSGVVSRSWNL